MKEFPRRLLELSAIRAIFHPNIRLARGILFPAMCSALWSCSAHKPPAPAATCAPDLDAGDVFSRHGVEGTFVLYDTSTGCTQTTDATMADTPFRPQSTFKLANTLIGLETGVIESADHTWVWDGTPQLLDTWEHDLNLGQALNVSCVPCFQDVARRVGAERMQQHLHDFDYGNADISGPIDRFWLDGQLRITPRQQAAFVHRMLTGQLPVKGVHVDTLWNSLEVERRDDAVYYGKTGMGTFDGRVIGWLVGYVERDGHRWTYATFVRSGEEGNIRSNMTRIGPIRETITRRLLSSAGVFSNN